MLNESAFFLFSLLLLVTTLSPLPSRFVRILESRSKNNSPRRPFERRWEEQAFIPNGNYRNSPTRYRYILFFLFFTLEETFFERESNIGRFFYCVISCVPANVIVVPFTVSTCTCTNYASIIRKTKGNRTMPIFGYENKC